MHLANDADDARLQALMSETPLADRAHRQASRHAEAAARRRGELLEQIHTLETQQDALLDEFTG